MTQLVRSADQFVVARGRGHTIIAGYPWFSDWGRDTMIAFNGLTLATGRPEIARDILLEYSRHISQGMIPNRFPDAGDEAEYNTVDATLWYFEAIRAYVETTGDHDFVRDSFTKSLPTSLSGTFAGLATTFTSIPTDFSMPVSRESSLPGWTRRSAIWLSRRESESRSRSRRSGTTRCASWPTSPGVSETRRSETLRGDGRPRKA